jgi:hypothetical protein
VQAIFEGGQFAGGLLGSSGEGGQFAFLLLQFCEESVVLADDAVESVLAAVRDLVYTLLQLLDDSCLRRQLRLEHLLLMPLTVFRPLSRLLQRLPA